VDLRCSCGNSINKAELWILKDTEDFEARKLFIGFCNKCHRPVVTLVESRISDGRKFVNENYTGNKAVRVIKRESKRFLKKHYKIETSRLYGWIYGVNTEIKNKRGEVTQIRQYSSDYYGQKSLTKTIKNE
jgi:hypothetical protein